MRIIIGTKKIIDVRAALINYYTLENSIESKMQNIWHVQHTDAQVSRNIIDNIKPKTQEIQKGYIPTHIHRDGTTKPHLNQDNQSNSKTRCNTQSRLPVCK